MKTTMKVLIADDDAEDMEMLKEGLSGSIYHHEIETVSNGAELLKLLKCGCKPDIIFLDLNMPLKSGLECLREMHNYEMVQNIPIILYSTSQNLKDIKLAAGFGARFYMIKPGCIRVWQQLVKFTFKLLTLPLFEQQKKEHFVIAEEKLAKVLNYHLSYEF